MSRVIITDKNWRDHVAPVVDGERKEMGLIPRDYSTHPVGYLACAKPFDLPLIDPSEWKNRLEMRKKTGATFHEIRATGAFGSRIPSRDQNGKGYCFPAGTLVKLGDGSHKCIENVDLLDEVLTAEGNVSKVKQCHVRDYYGEMYNIHLWGHNHLRCTDEHPIMTQRGYVAAKDLIVGDWIALPKYAPQSVNVVQTSEHVTGVKRRIKNTAGVAKFVEKIPLYSDGSVKRVPDFIKLNAGVGRILGLWLAEGHGTTWSFSLDEENTLVADLITLLQNEWGLSPRIVHKYESNVINVILHGKMWGQLFTSLCGKLAHGKCLHADLMSGPKEFLEALFWGWMDGDGKHIKNQIYSGCTVSRKLAMQMYDIANFLGLCPGIIKGKPRINEYAKTRRVSWHIQVNTNAKDTYRSKSEHSVTWRSVKQIEHHNFAGKVFNIGVEGDNSYVAEGIGVHNCWAHSSVSACLLTRAREHQPYVDLSAFHVACIIKGYRNQGGWGAESLEFIAEKGCASSEFWPQKSMDRANDKPEMWENAKLHRVTEWMDLEPRNMHQLVTCILLGIPVVSDFNWWGHSVCTMDLVEVHPEDLHADTIIWNSWGDGWSDAGEGELKGSKARPDGQLAPRVITAANV